MVRHLGDHLQGLHRGRIAGPDGTVGCCPDRSDHGDAGRGLDRHDRIASIDGALEGPLALDTHNIADLVHTKQGGHARHQVLAKRRGGTQHVVVVSCQRHDLGRQKSRQPAAVCRILAAEYPAD